MSTRQALEGLDTHCRLAPWYLPFCQVSISAFGIARFPEPHPRVKMYMCTYTYDSRWNVQCLCKSNLSAKLHDFTTFITLTDSAMLMTSMSSKQVQTIPNTASVIQPRISGCLDLSWQETHTHMHNTVLSENVPFSLLFLFTSFTRREYNTGKVDMHTFESDMRLPCFIEDKTFLTLFGLVFCTPTFVQSIVITLFDSPQADHHPELECSSSSSIILILLALATPHL